MSYEGLPDEDRFDDGSVECDVCHQDLVPDLEVKWCEGTGLMLCHACAMQTPRDCLDHDYMYTSEFDPRAEKGFSNKEEGLACICQACSEWGPPTKNTNMSEENVELHNTETRINKLGHKELVKKKKGKRDEETLNEINKLAGELFSQVESYDDLIDSGNFEKLERYLSGRSNRINLSQESIDFSGPLPTGGGAGSPQQPEYDRRHNVFGAPEAPTQTGSMERAANDSLSNMTAATPMAADGPEEQKAKINLPANPRGNPPRRKNNKEYTGDGLDYGATHSESFTGTGAIAIAPNISFGPSKPEDEKDEDDESTDTNTSESQMTQRRVLNEWDPPFEAGGYDPGDYQMPSPKGKGVAKRKAKQDSVGQYDTDTTSQGKEWPRDHNETAAMCDVDDDGVEHKPQGGHESSVGDPDDGHQEKLGHDWPTQPKHSGSGVAEPFSGTRWSDGGTLQGGSGQSDMGSAKSGQSKAAGKGPITGTSGPQYGEPQEAWSPEGIGFLMEGGDIDVRDLFNNYARNQIRTSNIICLESFQNLCAAHGCDAAINEQSLLYFMDANDEFLFFEGQDASGRYWVGKPFAESDCCDKCGCDPCECDDCVEEGAVRRPFRRTISELQVRSPEQETQKFRPERDESADFDDPLAAPSDVSGDPDLDPDYDISFSTYKDLENRQGPGPMSNMADMPEVDFTDEMEFGGGDEFGDVGVSSRPMVDYDPDEYEEPKSDYDKESMYYDMDEYDLDGEDFYSPGDDFGNEFWDQDEEAQGLERQRNADKHMSKMDYAPRGRGTFPSTPARWWEESKMVEYSPKSIKALKRFIESARSITASSNDSQAVGHALTESWKFYAKGVDARVTPPQVQKTLKQLMSKYKTFNPLSESDVRMDENQGKAISDKKAEKSPDLTDQPGPDEMQDHGDVFGGKQTNVIGTPVIKGTAKGMNVTHSESLRHNISNLANHVKKPLAEAVKGVKGKYNLAFSILVNEGTVRNRTNKRFTLAEALADAEELIQIHGPKNVVLEAYVIKNSEAIRKYDVPLVKVKRRGPIVAEGRAIFRFHRTAQKFAETLVMEGITCKLGPHNWGNSVAAAISQKKANKAYQSICG
jgi:hypothetical protein